MTAMHAKETRMATLTIRNLDEKLKSLLRIQAAQHDHSMEEEARIILKEALFTQAEDFNKLGSLIYERFIAVGGVELKSPSRNHYTRKPGNLT